MTLVALISLHFLWPSFYFSSNNMYFGQIWFNYFLLFISVFLLFLLSCCYFVVISFTGVSLVVVVLIFLFSTSVPHHKSHVFDDLTYWWPKLKPKMYKKKFKSKSCVTEMGTSMGFGMGHSNYDFVPLDVIVFWYFLRLYF